VCRKMRGICGLAEGVSASEEGLPHCSESLLSFKIMFYVLYVVDVHVLSKRRL
jgi:hypothetical protein